MTDLIRVAVVDTHTAIRDGIAAALNRHDRFDVVTATHDLSAAAEAEFDVCLLETTVDGRLGEALDRLGGRPVVVWTDREDWQMRVGAFARGAWSVLPRGTGHPSGVVTALLHAYQREIHLSPQLASALLDGAMRGALPLTEPQRRLLREIAYGTRPVIAAEAAGLTPDRFAAECEDILASCRAAEASRLDPPHVVPVAPIERPRILETLPTGRQMEVLVLLADGYSRTDAARRLGIEPKTVDRHLENFLKRIGVTGASTEERLLFAIYLAERHRHPDRLWKTRLRRLVTAEEAPGE